MSSDLAFADFMDRCCWRYVKQPAYRRTIENERPETTRTTPTRKKRRTTP